MASRTGGPTGILALFSGWQRTRPGGRRPAPPPRNVRAMPFFGVRVRPSSRAGGPTGIFRLFSKTSPSKTVRVCLSLHARLQPDFLGFFQKFRATRACTSQPAVGGLRMAKIRVWGRNARSPRVKNSRRFRMSFKKYAKRSFAPCQPKIAHASNLPP